MNKTALKKVARELVAPHKGILAADESTGTIEKRFGEIALASTEKNRRDYRELLFSAEGIENYVSGVILFEETLTQKSSDAILLPKLLKNKGILSGIKVDKKAHDLALFPGEKITEGLDGMRERLLTYKKQGAAFTKWRAVITIDKAIPTAACLEANAQALARYAALAQEAGLVPIVEPEVLMDGNHSVNRCEAVTQEMLKIVFKKLELYRVYLPGILLKPNMVVAGKGASTQPSVKRVAESTVKLFKKVIPKEVPGIVFLSGGQSPEQACDHLNAMNQIENLPWELSYSFGRALQQEALQAWKGKKANVATAQEAFLKRAEICSRARMGMM